MQTASSLPVLPSAPPWPWAPPRCPRCRSRKVLPQLENPTRGTGNGIMETIRNYGYDIIMLVALLVVASMFIGVCYHAYGTYAEIHTGRKTWGQFGLTVAIGAVLLVIGIWLLTEATGIL
jgi:integrating conjugative element membrane protein (TIGR03745 family)